MKLMEESGGTFSQVARFGKVVDNLHKSIQQSIGHGNRTMQDASEAYEELATSIGMQLDTLRQRLASDDLQGVVNIRDTERLKEQFTRFEQENIAPELKRAHSKLDHALDDWISDIESDYEKYAEPVKAFEDLISSIPRNILVVDDDEMYLEILQSVLEAEGYRVAKAKEGAQALAIMAKTKPDLVLLDLDMPGMGGIEVINKAKGHESLKNIPIIMLTGHSQKQVVREAITAGAIDFIVKPADRATLIEKVATHIAV
jgi:CheY-like chemotaxis protein